MNKDKWSIEQSRRLYHITAWSDGYVDIDNQGQVCVTPDRSNLNAKVNLLELSNRLQDEGLSLPILVRFSDILKDRVKVLVAAFNKAMQSNKYSANYTAVYPIKVNQQRRVIEDMQVSGPPAPSTERTSP